MIAADVHGKNHHRDGSFGNYVDTMDIALADGRVLTCSRTENPDLFFATIGGMGLTGFVLSARFRMIPIETAWINQETMRASCLSEAMHFFEESTVWPYTAVWIDCASTGDKLGRSVCFRGRHAVAGDVAHGGQLLLPSRRVRSLPIDCPSGVINSLSVRIFNEIYYQGNKPSKELIDYKTFFYPLDALLHWNRLYGRRGFFQYQCVLPKAVAMEGLTLLLQRIAKSGLGSFLAVLKLLGPATEHSPLSFPMEGYTLALDFPVSPHIQSLFGELDRIVTDHGGRLYLAKDGRMPSAMLKTGYKELVAFRATRARWSADMKFESCQSQRLEI
jgi:FAD/FMN-containing dehydrogenase